MHNVLCGFFLPQPDVPAPPPNSNPDFQDDVRCCGKKNMVCRGRRGVSVAKNASVMFIINYIVILFVGTYLEHIVYHQYLLSVSTYAARYEVRGHITYAYH